MNELSSEKVLATDQVLVKKARLNQSFLPGFFKTKIRTGAGMIIVICAAVSSMTLITAASAIEVWPDNGSLVHVVKTNAPLPKVLGEAIKSGDNKPVCVNGDCLYYQISNPNIQNFQSADPLDQAQDQPLASPGYDTDKKIVVSLNDQHLVYMEGTKIIGEFKISSGLKATPTPLGEYEISVKKPIVHYVGPGYNLPNTKWNLLFKPNASGNYYIHGAYWHNNFGRPMSHGCINVSYANMEALYDWADVGTKVIIQNEPIIPFADGTLVLDLSDGKTMYIIDSGKKRGFTSLEIFRGLGYNFSQVVKGNLSDYPTAQPIGSAEEPHPQGTLVKYGTAIYKITEGGKRLIPNENVFKSWAWVMAGVVEANAADLALPNLENVKYREGTLLKAYDGTIYIVWNGRLKIFSTVDLYGDKSDALMVISNAELQELKF